MKILVTGSSGMIGTEIVRLLKEKSIEIVEFSAEKGKDILDAEQLKKEMKNCQAVIHCAAILDEDAPRETLWKVNVDGTKNVLEAAAQNRVSRIVFLSTVGVYGNGEGAKNEETALQPETEYEKTKAAAEKLVEEFQEMVPFTIIRSALVIGPNAYWKQIFKAIQKNMPLPGAGTNAWQTIYYKDLANAVVFLLFLDAAENEFFVVAGNEKPSLKELVETIRSQSGMANPIKTLSPWQASILLWINGLVLRLQGKPNILSATNVKRMLHERNYDLTKIQAYGWKAKYPYTEALKETLAELQAKDGSKK